MTDSTPLRATPAPAATRCPECGVAEPTTACRFCGVTKVKTGTHDFRDAGDPLIKLDPDPFHWSRWAERYDSQHGRGR